MARLLAPSDVDTEVAPQNRAPLLWVPLELAAIFYSLETGQTSEGFAKAR